MVKRRRAPPRKAAPRRRRRTNPARARSKPAHKSLFWGEILGLAGMVKSMVTQNTELAAKPVEERFIYMFTGIQMDHIDPIANFKAGGWKRPFRIYSMPIIGEGMHRTLGKKMNSKLPWFLRV